MAAVLPFPRRRRRAVATRPVPAQVQLFPPSRDTRIVEGIAREMRAMRTDDQAEAVLVHHLEVEMMRFARLGVDEAAIERACQAFAVAAWSAAVRGDEAEGAA